MKPQQEQGLLGRMVGGMIRRSVGQCFRRVYWQPPQPLPSGPMVFACTHHGWHDGYLMYQAVKKLGVPTLDWIAEYDAFPLFGKVGGLPFPPGDAARRSATMRTTWTKMIHEGWSLMVFGDGVLRRPQEPWEVGRAVEAAVRVVPGVSVIPTVIHYDMSIHQRPEAYLLFGAAITGPFPQQRGELCSLVKDQLELMSEETRSSLGDNSKWEILQNCRFDVNERWDMRKSPLARS